MGYCSPSSSSWLSLRIPVVSPAAPNHKPLFFFFYSKSTTKTTTISCCTTTDDSSYSSPTVSFTRRSLRSETPPKLLRHWIEAHQDQPLPSQERFTVVSYNILGDRNASNHSDLYTNVPSPYMKWAYRKRVICEELIGWSPDVICLQEVDRYSDLLNVLKKAGYTGSYKRRTGDYIDGCAMFWKADMLRLLEGESIEYKRLSLRDNVAQLSVLEVCKAESKRLVVGNIHVLYNPHRGEVKLGQIRFLLSRAQVLSKKWGNIPIVLAGDFNSTPQSAIYKFLSSSEVNIMLYDRKELSGQRNCRPSQVFGVKKEMRSPLILLDRFLNNFWTDEEVKVATGNTRCNIAVHPLKLNSSYATIKGSRRTRDFHGEPFATSYHSKFLGTVDYLWYSDGVVPTGVLDTLPFEVLKQTGGLPCKKLGSDHLALVSKFAFT